MDQAAQHPFLNTTYDVMVERLFKKMDTPENKHGSLMHAVSALLGEAVEWRQSGDRGNFIEEGGDMEFYIQAIFQSVQLNVNGAFMGTVDSRARNLTLGNVFDNIVSICNDLFDQGKKAWVYGKEPDRNVLLALLAVLRYNLDFAYDMFGTNILDVQFMNKRKLIGPGGRYESGFYSDAQAIARRDKLTGEPVDIDTAIARTFIGKPE